MKFVPAIVNRALHKMKIVSLLLIISLVYADECNVCKCRQLCKEQFSNVADLVDGKCINEYNFCQCYNIYTFGAYNKHEKIKYTLTTVDQYISIRFLPKEFQIWQDFVC